MGLSEPATWWAPSNDLVEHRIDIGGTRARHRGSRSPALTIRSDPISVRTPRLGAAQHPFDRDVDLVLSVSGNRCHLRTRTEFVLVRRPDPDPLLDGLPSRRFERRDHRGPTTPHRRQSGAGCVSLDGAHNRHHPLRRAYHAPGARHPSHNCLQGQFGRRRARRRRPDHDRPHRPRC